MVLSTKDDCVDDFYETIRAPQFFDFTANDDESSIDSWFGEYILILFKRN